MGMQQEVMMTTLMKLIRKMRSPENKRVLEAIEEMRVRSWLTDGSLKNHRLCQVHMQGADLFEANLSKVDLHQANLEWADLSQANLRGARLTRVNLRSANFSQTQLSGADLLKADLGGARNLTDEQLSQVKRLCFAIMPNGATYDGRYNLQGDLDLARWQKVDVDDPEAMAYFYGVPLEVYLHAQGMEIQEA